MGRTGMVTLDDALAAIEQFRLLRHSSLGRLEVGGKYSLSTRGSAGHEADQFWPEEWEHADRCGVYLILDVSMRLLYVGKASMGNQLWNRLGTYFGGRGKCKIKHDQWSDRPEFVVTVAVPEESTWEAPALEEFLIGKLQPVDNVRGCRQLS